MHIPRLWHVTISYAGQIFRSGAGDSIFHIHIIYPICSAIRVPFDTIASGNVYFYRVVPGCAVCVPFNRALGFLGHPGLISASVLHILQELPKVIKHEIIVGWHRVGATTMCCGIQEETLMLIIEVFSLFSNEPKI